MSQASQKPNVLLIAEDDFEDQLLLKRAIGKCTPSKCVQFVDNGEELMEYLHRKKKFATPDKSPFPDLILLDLKMPRKDGREALREIRSDKQLRTIPVVVLTTSSADIDVRTLYAIGANSYITKPDRFTGWIALAQTITEYWFGMVCLPPRKDNEA